MLPIPMHLIRRPITHLQALLVLAIALGGGGIVYGFRHMVIQLAALAILAINSGHVQAFVREAQGGLKALLIVTMVLPLVQVIPLPAAVWQALPGRDLVVESYQVAGIALDSWFSFSVDPMRTFTAFCATLAPAAIIVLGWSMPQPDRALLARTLVAVAIVVFALGAVQLSSANSVALFQRIEPEPDVLYGTFSNRNSTGLFFVICAIVMAALPMRKGSIWPLVTGLVGVLFILAVILTQSRSSMTLVVVLLVFVGVKVGATILRRPERAKDVSRNRLIAAGSIVALLLVAGAIAASAVGGGRAAQSFERFSQIDDDRLEMWDDGAFVAGRYWPLGAGTGTFDEVFQIDESLEYISPARAGRAHNDYIELAIETGVVGLIVLVAWFAWLASATWRRRTDPDRWLAFAAYASFVCIALQSVLDYPLRNQALLCTAAMLIVLLFPARERTT